MEWESVCGSMKESMERQLDDIKDSCNRNRVKYKTRHMEMNKVGLIDWVHQIFQNKILKQPPSGLVVMLVITIREV